MSSSRCARIKDRPRRRWTRRANTMVLPVPVGNTSKGRCTPRAVAASRAATASYWYGRGGGRNGAGGWATASMQCAPKVVGMQRADAVPEGFTDCCPKCASGDARLQRGVPGSSWLCRRLVSCTPGRGWAHPTRQSSRPARPPCHRVASTLNVCPIAAACPSRRDACGLERLPRQALGVRGREATVDDHNRDALRPGFALRLRHREGRFPRRCCRPRTHRQYPRHPGVADVLAPPIRCRWEHRHLLPPERGLAGELAPLLLPGGIRIKREDERTPLPGPLPAPALHAKDRDHTRDPCSQERQRIKGALADPQRSGVFLQRRRVEVAFRTWEMIVALSFGDLRCSPDG